MGKSSQEQNRRYQKAWYERQKQEGNIVYLITLKDGNTYVGSTTSSLKKRIWQHRSKDSPLHCKGYNLEEMKVIVLEEVNPNEDLRERETIWIRQLNPTINKLEFPKKIKVPELSKPIYEGIVYSTQYDLWRALGKTKYGTFKTRLFRHGKDFGYALGLKELNLS